MQWRNIIETFFPITGIKAPKQYTNVSRHKTKTLCHQQQNFGKSGEN